MIKGRLEINKIITILFSLLFLIVFVVDVYAEEPWYLNCNIEIRFDRAISCMIINDRGETLCYDAEKDEITGDLEISNKSKVKQWGIRRNYHDMYQIEKKVYRVDVERESDSFTYIPLDDGETFFAVGFRDDYSGSSILANNSSKIQIAKSYYSVEGENCTYAINDGRFTDYEEKYDDENTYNIYGKTNNKVCLSRALSDEAIITGVKNTYLWVNINFFGYYGCFIDGAYGKIYSYEDAISISHNGKYGRNLVASGTCRLCNEQYGKRILTKYIEEINDGKDMLFTWNEVKKAKSYVVYKYDTNTGKCIEDAVIKDCENNFYFISNINNEDVYKYNVVACSDEDGKTAIEKMGKPVSAVSSNNEMCNVKKIKLNRTGYYDLKKGKKIKIKAKLIGEDGKKVLSDDIKWITTNKKVVSVTQNGVIKTRRRNYNGVEVWARAHNGVESKHIEITVY